MNASLFRFKNFSIVFLALSALVFASTAFAQAESDISVTSVENSADPVIAGSPPFNIDYTFTVTNNGPDEATSVVIDMEFATTIAVPACAIITSQGTGILTSWAVGTLANGASATYQLQCNADSTVPDGATLSMLAALASLDQTDPDDTNNSATEDSTVALEVDIALSATKSIDPVVAGSGTDNLEVSLIVANIGPSDATGVVVDTVWVLPAGVVPTSFTPSQGTVDEFGVWTIGALTVAQGEVNLTAVLTVGPTTVAGTDVISGTATVSAADQPDGDETNDTITGAVSVRETSATFRVGKVFTEGDGPSVNMTLTCNGVIEDTGSVTGGGFVSLTATGFLQDVFGTTNCVVSEEIPAGYFPAYSADCDVTAVDGAANATEGEGVYACTVTNAETHSTFLVTKAYSDGNLDAVEVTLTCNTGLPLEQSFEISDGNPVDFVMTNFVEGEMDCEVTETGTADGYTPSYDNGSVVSATSCVFADVTSSAHSCAITNTVGGVTFTVNKVWDFVNDGNDMDTSVDITITCDSEITNDGASEDDGTWSYTGTTLGTDYISAQVIPELPYSTCSATEDDVSSAVEVDNQCSGIQLSAGQGNSCTITNTVFFEGIPTLNQYGLAILALLMLGVGFVGFRRFV